MKPFVSLVLFLGLTALSAGAQTTIFSAPGAGTGPTQGTFPVAINSSGLIAGYYLDSSGLGHGFTYKAGVISTFEAFGNAAFTYVAGMNASGAIVGNFQGHTAVSTGALFGFVRSATGQYTIIEGATGNQNNQILTYATAINASGEVVGYWININTNTESAFTYSNGVVTDFTVNGNPDSIPTAINDSGVVVGGGDSPFIRDALGNITILNPPNDGGAIYPTAINASGQVAGYYETTSGPAAFLYDPTDQSYTVVPFTGALSMSSGIGPGGAVALNDAGEIGGAVTLSNGIVEAWTYSNGTVHEFTCPNDVVAAVTGINDRGQLTGYCGNFGGGLDGFIH